MKPRQLSASACADDKETMDFDGHSLRVLEYARIIDRLAERTASALGAERARELLPSPVVAFVNERQQETAEARLLAAQHGVLPLGGIHDLRPSLIRAEVGQSLTPHDLLDVAATLVAASRLKTYLARYAASAPLLADHGRSLDEFPQLVGDIENSIGRGGDVLDSASPALAGIRARQRTVAARITERLTHILNSSTYKAMIQDPVIVLRDDRRCIPVRAEHRREFKGIVHDQSSSGATLFMEPMVVVELNNELRQIESKERQEVERVLAKITAGVARLGGKIHGTLDILAGLDLAHAKARIAEDMQAVQPTFNRNGVIRLREARHPLLDPNHVVPITVHFGDTFKVLLITGPNTGGKTVTLKTVGLLTLMAQAGLQIPAETGSELAFFDQVFADIGDEQSIQQSLSTFSAHITNIVRILKTVGTRALILLDELGAGTDPAEGAALAKAILGSLIEHNARVIATTHYGELKEFAYSREGIQNSAVEFDPESLRPTYRLLQGVPGSSNAFHIARRLGMPNRVVDDAAGNLDRQEVETGVVMQSLEKAKRIADEERRRAERLARELDDMKSKYEARLRDLEILRREAKQRAAEEARSVIKQKTEKMDNIIGELRRIGKEGRKTQSARKRMQEASLEMIGEIGYEREPLPPDEAEVPLMLKRGERVRVLSLGGAEGEVIDDSRDGEALVQVGIMRVTVPLSALRNAGPATARSVPGKATAAPPTPRERAAAGENAAPGQGSASALAFAKTAAIAPEIKLIGMRVDAALPRLDKYIDDAYAAGIDGARLVHGKGTGQLRKAIWEFLRNDTRIASFQMAHPDDGGAGATVLQFRQ
jgi:DNA mismatch repair protein MutS2